MAGSTDTSGNGFEKGEGIVGTKRQHGLPRRVPPRESQLCLSAAIAALFQLEREVLELSLPLDPQHHCFARFELSYG